MNIDNKSVLHELGTLIAQMKQSADLILTSTRGDAVDRPTIDYHAGLLATGALGCQFWLLVAETGGRLSRSNAPVQINFHNEFTKCIAAFRQTSRRENIKLSLRYMGSPITFIGSHPSTAQIPFILLDNAVKYATSFEDVEVSLQNLNGSLQCTVTNTGPLIDDSELRKIVEIGGRGALASQSGVPGSGLGLALLGKIVDAANGTVCIQCSPLSLQINGIDQGLFKVDLRLPSLE